MILDAQVTFYQVQSQYMEWHFAFITPLDSWNAPVRLLFASCLLEYHQMRAAVQKLVSSTGRKQSCQMHLEHKLGRHPAILWAEIRREKN